MKKIFLLVAAVFFGLCGSVYSQGYDYPTATQNIPAFPTAEGFGKFATGGRGGRVVTVTTLEDDANNPPVGSLRWALAQYPDEPVTVVFNVSGWIILKDVLSTKRTAGLTIAGQTAPGEGITVFPRMFSINGAKNVIVRNMRFRAGTRGWDGTDIVLNNEKADQALCAENTEHIVFDHCTFGWAVEEIINNQDSHFNTFSYCLLHEGLYNAGHHKGERSYACQWGGSQSTFHHNMLAHNRSRSPRFQGARNTDYIVYNEYVNNVNFNWGGDGDGACYGGENSSESNRFKGHQVNFCNNYYRKGPASNVDDRFQNFACPTSGKYVSEWHFSGNYMDESPEATADNKKGVKFDSDKIVLLDEFIVPDKFVTNYKFDWFTYTMKDKLQTAEDAYHAVLDKVGCIVRDSIERRVVRECREGSATLTSRTWEGGGKYGIIDDPTDAEIVNDENNVPACPFALPSESRPEGWDTDGDGMPDEWETANGFNPSDPSDGNYINAEGYTALEKYLCGIMGEEIKGQFGSATSIRTEHAVKFDIQVEGSVLKVMGGADICGLHVFDESGRCRLTGRLQAGENTVDISFLPQGVYIVWVTDSEGYRNAVKFRF